MFTKRIVALAVAVLVLTVTTLAVAEDFTIDWYTVDNGGGYSAGGDFELEGTIGQPDAGVMAAEAFELTGGFWTTSQTCTCPGDMNGDGALNGLDIQNFVTCFVAGGDCSCADVDAVNGITVDDVGAFVAALVSGAACP